MKLGIVVYEAVNLLDVGPTEMFWPARSSRLERCALGRMISDPPSYLRYLRLVAENARWLCSVCEGALLLAPAGLQSFQDIEVDVSNPRFVVSGNRLTGGGVSSRLDEALQLIMLLFDDATAQNVQTQTQYFPKPPVDAPFPQPRAPACMVRW